MTPTHPQSRRTTHHRGHLLLAIMLAACGALLAGPLEAGAQSDQPSWPSTAATVTNSAITEYATPTPFSGPVEVNQAADGRIWFAEAFADSLGAINSSGLITEYPLPTGTQPWFISPLGATADHPAELFVNGYGIGGYVGLDGSPLGWASFYSTFHTTGIDGTTLWFTDSCYLNDPNDPESDCTLAIGKVTSGGDPTYYRLPGDSSVDQLSAIAPAPDGSIWFAGLSNNTGLYLGKLATDGTITEYPTGVAGLTTPRTEGTTLPRAFSFAITAGPDGNMWFTMPFANSIGRITPDGVVTVFDTGTLEPSGITAGPDGNLWFTSQSCNLDNLTCSILAPDANAYYAGHPAMLGRITPSGDVTSYPLPTPTGGGWGITTGSDGNLWFTETDASKIGTMSTSPLAPPAPVGASGASSATITVSPNPDGPAPTTYVVTASPGGKTCNVTGATGSCTISGLSNGKKYTFTTTAANTSPRASAASAASAPVKIGYLALRLNRTTNTTITTTFNAPGVGWVQQYGYSMQQSRASTSHQLSICGLTKKVNKAGKTKLTCTMTKAAQAARKRGTLVVSMVTTFMATGKAPVASTTTLTLRHH